ncbi:PilW family protein [Marinobacter lacisalsi]|uniref:PilW family protein n=1 Tax=Marinobacter lacisalsi TaxID=475979 RepID=A0ABV8QKP4_9GAMM
MHRAAGLSLVELMIALLLGVILTLGATQVYLGTSQSYRLTDGIAHVQETVRFASTMMQRDVRSAGSLSCLQNADDVDIKLNGTRVVALGDGITGWEAAGSASGDALVAGLATPADGASWSEGSGVSNFPAELVGRVVAGTDILIVNTTETVPATVTGNSTGQINTVSASGIAQGRIILSVDDNCSSGELFQKANNATADSVSMAGVSGNPGGFVPGNQASSGFQSTYGGDSRIAEFSTKAYYVGISGATGEPALFMQLLGGNAEPRQELVEGVESMQVMYGLSENQIRQADRYVSANQVTDWSEVMSLRVSFVVRSGGNANSEDITRTFNLLGTEVTSPADRRARVVASTTIGLRNRLE